MATERRQNEPALVYAAKQGDKEALQLLLRRNWAWRTIYGGSLRVAVDTVWLAMVSAVGAILILGLGGWLIAKFFPSFGALGPWCAATVSIIAVGLANRWRFKSNRWMQIDLFKRRRFGMPVEV